MPPALRFSQRRKSSLRSPPTPGPSLAGRGSTSTLAKPAVNAYLALRIMAKQLPNPPKVGMVSLGCPKALVDSERILTKLRADGYALSPSYDDADVVLVNT